MKFLKPVVFGILMGAALFYMPFFVLRATIVFLIIGGLFRFFRGGKWHHRGPYRNVHERRLAFVDKVRAMSDEEYSEFKQKHSQFRGFGDETSTSPSLK